MARDPDDPRRFASVDSAVREMFDALIRRPIPSRLLSLIDQLDETSSEAAPPRRRKPKRA